MTNEQIEKRFLFDLETGLFKMDRLTKYLRFIGEYNEIKKLVKILESYSYEQDFITVASTIHWSSGICVFKPEKYSALTITNYRKYYYVFSENKNVLEEHYKKNNEIPEYIKEYKV